MPKILWIHLMSLFALLFFTMPIHATNYYLDVVHGNNQNPGTSALPWKTIRKALSVAESGDTVFMRSGHYGSFEESKERNGWVTFMAEPGASPVIRNLRLGGSSFDKNTYLRFNGIKILADPSLGELEPIVNIIHAFNVELVNCTIRGYDYFKTIAVTAASSQVRIHHCEISHTNRGILFLGVAPSIKPIAEQWMEITNNYIHDFAGSGILINEPTRILIEGNHIYRQWPYNPALPTNAEPAHGSGIGLLTRDAIVRNNIVHACGNTGLFTIYGEEGDLPGGGKKWDAVAENIIVENNLFYDGGDVNMMEIKARCKFNNNTVIGHAPSKGTKLPPTTDFGRYVMGQVRLYHWRSSYQNDFEFYNNLVVSQVNHPSGEPMHAGGNYVWAYEYAPYTYGKNLAGSVVLSPNGDTTIFGQHTFIQHPIDFSYPDDRNTFVYANQVLQDFRLKPGAPAINQGIAGKGPAKGLGIIGPDGFIIDNGVARDADHHSAGAYEFNGANDNEAPSAPGGLAASNKTYTSFTVSWNASTDNTGVTKYYVYKNDVLETAVTGTTATITGLLPGTTYRIAVKAQDAASNLSAPGTANIATLTDSEAPEVPAGLSAVNKTTTGFTLKWNSSADNVSVTGYNVYKNGAFLTFVPGTAAFVSNLIAGTTYHMTVQAKDQSGNLSALSLVLPVATNSSGDIVIGEKQNLTGSDNGNGSRILAQQVTLSQPGSIMSMSFFVTKAEGTLMLGIYSDNHDHPGTLLAHTATFATVAGWNTQPVVTAVPLAAGTYWLAYLPSSDKMEYRQAHSGKSKHYLTVDDELPSTFSPLSSGAEGFHCMLYATLSTETILHINEQPHSAKKGSSSSSSIIVYPNPVAGNEFYIDFGNAGPGTQSVEIIDINGRRVLYKSTTAKNNRIMSIKNGLKTGVYMVRIKRGLKTETHKLVVQ